MHGHTGTTWFLCKILLKIAEHLNNTDKKGKTSVGTVWMCLKNTEGQHCDGKKKKKHLTVEKEHIWITFKQAFIHCYRSPIFVVSGRIHLIIPARLLNKQERRSEVRGGEGSACLLARRSLASHPLASCQLYCPSPSLNPLRQTGCQCREAASMPHRTNTPTANFCSVFIYTFAVCLCLKNKRTG